MSPGVVRSCRSCDAMIEFATMRKSRSSMPLNLGPDPNGNLMQVGEFAGQGIFVRLTKDELEVERARGTPLRLSHFATCPGAAENRKRGHAVVVDE